MANIIINDNSFINAGWNEYGAEVGTVEVNGKVCRAVRDSYGISVHGYVGRYRTSPKPWAAHVTSGPRGVYVNFGRDDRSGRFNKQNAISYEPALFDTLTNAKYWTAA